MEMMRIDIDWMSKRTSRFLISLQKPYWIRKGNKGVNIKKEDCPGCSQMPQDERSQTSCYDCWLYVIFDDRNRLKLNRQQEYCGLSHNILWDVKKGKSKPGEWTYIESEQDIDKYLRQFTGYY